MWLFIGYKTELLRSVLTNKPVPTNADKKMQVFLAQKCKSVFIQNQPQFGKFLNKDLNLIRIKIE